jgi:hypothetical protein
MRESTQTADRFIALKAHRENSQMLGRSGRCWGLGAGDSSALKGRHIDLAHLQCAGANCDLPDVSHLAIFSPRLRREERGSFCCSSPCLASLEP